MTLGIEGQQMPGVGDPLGINTNRTLGEKPPRLGVAGRQVPYFSSWRKKPLFTHSAGSGQSWWK